jgi:hypothetical protein
MQFREAYTFFERWYTHRRNPPSPRRGRRGRGTDEGREPEGRHEEQRDVVSHAATATRHRQAQCACVCAHRQRAEGRAMQKARNRMQEMSWHLAITVLTVWLVLLGAGCAGVRPARRRSCWRSARSTMPRWRRKARAFRQRIIERLKARYDAQPGAPVIYDILVLSGSGDWGVFGAGFLKGWSRVQGPLAMPEFDVVTGVSTDRRAHRALCVSQRCAVARHHCRALSQSRAGPGQAALAALLSARR